MVRPIWPQKSWRFHRELASFQEGCWFHSALNRLVEVLSPMAAGTMPPSFTEYYVVKREKGFPEFVPDRATCQYALGHRALRDPARAHGWRGCGHVSCDQGGWDPATALLLPEMSSLLVTGCCGQLPKLLQRARCYLVELRRTAAACSLNSKPALHGHSHHVCQLLGCPRGRSCRNGINRGTDYLAPEAFM